MGMRWSMPLCPRCPSRGPHPQRLSDVDRGKGLDRLWIGSVPGVRLGLVGGGGGGAMVGSDWLNAPAIGTFSG